jgi:hypothetical protein
MQRRCDVAENVVARCTRLESLMNAQHYTPSAWLHLSQLHTLGGVDLSVVSMAAIAAALPRLHTLAVFAYPPGVPAAAVAGFFGDLLPPTAGPSVCWTVAAESPRRRGRVRIDAAATVATSTDSHASRLL